MSNKGWIKIDRVLQTHWLWEKDKPFDVRSAWLDMLLSANHADNKFPLGNEMVFVPRGTFITSERKLAEKWEWSNTKVRNFLKLLQSDEMIVKKTDNKKSTITIVNYSVYQDSESTETQQKHQSSIAKASVKHQSSISRASQEHTNKNEKNDKECFKNEKNDKEVKHKYGAYAHVLLTDTEMNRLINDYGNETFTACIKKLDEYLEIKGVNKYKNHNLVIRNWVIKAVMEDVQKENNRPNNSGKNDYNATVNMLLEKEREKNGQYGNNEYEQYIQ